MSGIILGQDVAGGEAVAIDELERRQGLYIIGKNGTGKTSLIEDLVVQDMASGGGLCVLDPHGDLVDHLLARVPAERERDVILLDPRDTEYPFGLNPYECADPSDAELVGRISSQVVELFEKLWGQQGSEGTSWGPRVAQVIRNTALTLIENPGYTMAEIPLLLTDRTFRDQLTRGLGNTQVALFWETFNRMRTNEQVMFASSTMNKLDEFLTQPVVLGIVGQSESTINFRQVMDEGKILLVRLGLGRLGEPIVELLGSVIVLQIVNAALSREELAPSARRQFSLYADEYHRFATPAFATLLAEARKYAVATTIAHQYRWQLDALNRGASLNTGNIAVFSVLGEDAEELAKEFNASPPLPDVVGQRPTRTITQDPVGHLVRHGHQRDNVRSLVASQLSPLVSDLAGLGPDEYAVHIPRSASAAIGGRSTGAEGDIQAEAYEDRGAYRTAVDKLRSGIEEINKYLVDVMEQRLDPWSVDGVSRVVLIAATLRGVLGIAKDSSFRLSAPASPLSDFSQAAMTALALGLAARGMGEDVDIGERYNGLVAARAEALRDELVPTLRTSATVEDQLSIVTKRAYIQAKEFMEFVLGMMQIGIDLKEAPILVDSGQWEPIYDRPRQYADVQNEIATALVNLPNYTARVKVQRPTQVLECTLRTCEYMATDESRDTAGRVERIRARSRGEYARQRGEIEAQIEERQRRSDMSGGPQRIAQI